MNLPTIGALMRQFPISDFSIMSKVITEVNGMVTEEYFLHPDMTGEDILRIYHTLPYDAQQSLYEKEIISRVEEQGLYNEIKIVSENSLMKETYDNNMSSTLLLDLNILLLVVFAAVTLLYRQNTIANGDQIEANLLTTIISVLTYLVTSIV